MTIHTNGERADAPLRQDHDGNVILSLGEYRQHLIADHGYPEADVLPPERPDNLAQWRALDAKHEAARRSPCYSATEATERTRPRLIDVTPLGSAERVFEEVPEADVEAFFRSTAAAVGLTDVDEAWATASKLIPRPTTPADVEAIGGALRANVEDRTISDLPTPALARELLRLEAEGLDAAMPTLPADGSEVRISMEPDATGTPTLDVEQQPTDEHEDDPTSVLLGISRILSWYVLPAVTIGVQVATARRHPQLRGYHLTMATMGAAHTVARTIELHNSWQNRQATR